MGLLSVAALLCLCFTSAFATYGGNDYKNHGGPKNHPFDGHAGGKLEGRGIHLDSAKIILDRPSINVHHGIPHHGGPLLEDEPIILENDKPLYIRKTLHGDPAPHPVVLDGGYSAGKVLDISAPIQVINHAPVVHERPILIRRPVLVSKGLAGTQEHLERLHYATHSGLAHHAGGYGYGIPVSRGLHEKTVVYGGLGHGLGHGFGHGLGHVVPATYSAPLIYEQHRAYLGHADIGYGSGKGLQGAVVHGGALHGGHGAVLHGHGGALHGGHGAVLHGGHGPVLHGAVLHGGHGPVLHGAALHGGHGPVLHGAALHGGHGAVLHGHGTVLHGHGGSAPKKY